MHSDEHSPKGPRSWAPRHRIACIVIATDARQRLVWEHVWQSVRNEGFDDVIVVGDWEAHCAPINTSGYGRYLCVAPLTRTTTDALIKRDVGTLATTADVLVYLCDDHALAPGFGAALRAVLDEPWDVIVPNRYTTDHNTIHSAPLVPLNNGERHGYCGGHGGVFRRAVVTAAPWSTMPHHRNWDVLASGVQRERGARFCFSPRADLAIIDLNPNDPLHELGHTQPR